MSGIRSILIKARQPVTKQKPSKEVAKKSKNGYQSIVDKTVKEYKDQDKHEAPAFWKGK